MSGQNLVFIHSLVSGLSISAIATTFNAINLGVEQMECTGGFVIISLMIFVSGGVISLL